MYNKNFSKEPTEKQKIGQIGENSACEYLEKNGYRVVERNYLKKWGEIDIIAKKGNKIHFIEVKSVSRDLLSVTHETKKISLIDSILDTVRGGSENRQGGVHEYIDENIFASNKEMYQNNGYYRAEDNMHPWKLQRLGRAVQSYLLDRDIPDEVEWQFDLVVVYVDLGKRLSRVEMIEDIVL